MSRTNRKRANVYAVAAVALLLPIFAVAGSASANTAETYRFNGTTADYDIGGESADGCVINGSGLIVTKGTSSTSGVPHATTVYYAYVLRENWCTGERVIYELNTAVTLPNQALAVSGGATAADFHGVLPMTDSAHPGTSPIPVTFDITWAASGPTVRTHDLEIKVDPHITIATLRVLATSTPAAVAGTISGGGFTWRLDNPDVGADQNAVLMTSTEGFVYVSP